MTILMISAGLLLLFLGGEALLRSSLTIADKMGFSNFVVSVVVIGFGTSAPEAIVSVLATLQGAPKLALGNVVGSNIANILLILGVSALITPVQCRVEGLKRDLGFVTLISLSLGGLIWVGSVSRIVGIIYFVLLLGYLISLVRVRDKNTSSTSGDPAEVADATVNIMSLYSAAGLFILGVAMLGGGAHLLVQGALTLAQALGVSNAVVGLTIVAVGTSLPELATAVVAAYRKHPDIVIGNIVGSNMFNLLGVLGVTATVSPIPIDGRIASFDIWFMIGVTTIFYLLIQYFQRLKRSLGAVFLLSYAWYSYSLFA